MKTCFVTGGSGFVGRPLVRALITNGCAVRALARSATSARELQAAGAEVVMGELSDPAALRRGCEDAVTVINCAGHLKMWDTEEVFRKTNVEGTRNLLGAAKSVGVKRFVQIGASASVMGNPKPMVDIREDTYPLSFPDWFPYIKTKAEAEALVLKENNSNFSTSVIRPPLIWGVGSPLLPDVVREVRSGRFGWIDRGEYEFSACHVRNVVQAILLAAERASGGRSYFVTDGRNYVFRRFFTELLATQETSAPSRSFPFRVAWMLAPVVEGAWSVLHLKNDPPLTRQMVRMIGLPFTLNIDRARQELQYEPALQFEQGIRELKGA